LTIAPDPQDGGVDLPVAQTGWLKQVLAGRPTGGERISV